MQVALNGLIEQMWTENAIQDARHHELSLERRQGIVGIIQAIGSQIHNLDPMQKWKIRNKIGIDWARTNVQAIYYWKAIYHWILEFSRRSYDQFITAFLGLEIPTTPLFIQLYLFYFKLFNVLGKSTIDDGGLAFCSSMIALIMVG